MSRPNLIQKAGVVLLALTTALLAAGCNEWAAFRWDAGLTNANTTDTAVNAATVASVTPQFAIDVSATPQLVVSGGRVFGYATGNSTLWAADATGTAGSGGCSTEPVVCRPVWTAPVGTTNWAWLSTWGDTVLAARRKGDATGVAAFDAAGTAGCSGTPTVCSPRWSTGDTTATAGNVAGDRLYVVHAQPAELRVYDAAGELGCNGTPRVCSPLWTAPLDATATEIGAAAPAVAGGHVYVATDTGFAAFDAAGSDGCAGTPRVCAPQWRTELRDDGFITSAGATRLVATADAVITLRVQPGSGTGLSGTTVLDVSDARGVQGCTGVPVVCTPRWAAPLRQLAGSPAVADGRVVVQHGDVTSLATSTSTVTAFDLAGTTGCDGAPRRCRPLWEQSAGTVSPAWRTDVTIVRDLVFTTLGQGFGVAAIAARRTDTGATVWTTNAGFIPPIVSGGRIYLPTTSGIQVLAPAD